MKPIVKKILEAGLVDKYVSLMLEKWGQLEPGATDLVGRRQITQANLHQFVEEIEELMESDRGKVETFLEVWVFGDKETYIVVRGKNIEGIQFEAAVDNFGRLVVMGNLGLLGRLHPGDRLTRWITAEKVWKGSTVLLIEEIAKNSRVVGFQITVEEDKG